VQVYASTGVRRAAGTTTTTAKTTINGEGKLIKSLSVQKIHRVQSAAAKDLLHHRKSPPPGG